MPDDDSIDLYDDNNYYYYRMAENWSDMEAVVVAAVDDC